MRNQILVGLFGMLLHGAGIANADTMTIQFPGYPKPANRSCLETAQTAGATFAKEAGVELLEASYLLEEWGRCDLQILFRSPSPLPLVVSPEWIAYRSQESCQVALGAEETFFVKTTGLSPVFKYCSHLYEGYYTPAFYALGKPTKQLKSVRLDIDQGVYSGDGPSLESEIKAKSVAVGLPLVQSYVGSTQNRQPFFLLRFAEDPLKPIPSLTREYLLKPRVEREFMPSSDFLNGTDPLRFDTVTDCESQKKSIESIFADRFTSPVVWFCILGQASAHLYHLRIRPGEESFEKITPGEDSEPFANQYGSFEACEKDKARVTAHYKAKYGNGVVGAICSTKQQTKPALPSRVYVYIETGSLF